jgi:DNA mismatch repair protein MutS2
LGKAREEGEKIKLAIVEEAETILRETNKQAENVIREIRESRADPDHVRRVRSAFSEHGKQIEMMKKQKPAETVFGLHPDDWVTWVGHGGRAKVLSDPDGKGKVWIQWNDVRLQVLATECRLLESPIEAESSKAFVSIDTNAAVSNEVDLRGMTVEESFQILEKYLSDAVMAGLSQVLIIPGKGTGVLRKEVGRYLSRHPLVRNKRFGHWNEGDVGVTVVELK